MDISFTSILSIAAQILAVAAVTFIVVCLVTSHMRFHAATKKISEGVGTVVGGASGFQLLITDRMAIECAEGKVLNVLLVSPNEYVSLKADQSDALADEMVRFVETRLRSVLRSRDRVAVFEPGLVGVLLEAPAAMVGRISNRIWEDIAREPMPVSSGIGLDITVRIASTSRLHAAATAQSLIDEARSNFKNELNPGSLLAPARASHHDAGQSAGQRHILDELTGVLKQAYVEGSLQKFFSLQRRDEHPISLLCVDVDQLKRYNEQYGRETGDRIIKAAGNFLQRATREEDLIGRCGDNAFVVSLAAAPAQSMAIARRLLSMGKKTGALAIGEGLKFSISIGVAGYPDHGATAPQLLEAAQRALRIVKARGRNNAAFPEPEVRREPARDRPVEEGRDVF